MIGRHIKPLVAAMLVSALAAWSPSVVEAAQSSQEETKSFNELLRDFEIHVAQIAEHAAKLERMVEQPAHYSLTSHEFEWRSIKTRLNDAGDLLPKLQAVDAKKWQKDIITHMASLTKAMEVQVESGIKLVADATMVERLVTTNNVYAIRARSVYHYAEHIVDLIELTEGRRVTTS